MQTFLNHKKAGVDPAEPSHWSESPTEGSFFKSSEIISKALSSWEGWGAVRC